MTEQLPAGRRIYPDVAAMNTPAELSVTFPSGHLAVTLDPPAIYVRNEGQWVPLASVAGKHPGPHGGRGLGGHGGRREARHANGDERRFGHLPDSHAGQAVGADRDRGALGRGGARDSPRDRRRHGRGEGGASGGHEGRRRVRLLPGGGPARRGSGRAPSYSHPLRGHLSLHDTNREATDESSRYTAPAEHLLKETDRTHPDERRTA